MQIDLQKSAVMAAGLIAGASVFIFKTNILAPDANLSNLVATIFSVLAGFLAVALNLVVLSAPPAFKSRVSQRRYFSVLGRRLRRHNWLFYSYLVVLISVFLSQLFLSTWNDVSKFFESIYLSVAAASLIWSFSIPSSIANIQSENARLARLAREHE